MTHVLEVDSLIKSFGFKHLLTDIYLKCTTDEVLGILGRNGTGKSTLLQIIFGSMEAESKSIRIDGQFYANPYTEGDKIGYLPQSDFLPNDDTVTSVVKRFLPSEPSRNLVSSNE